MLGQQVYISSFGGGVQRTEEEINLSSQPDGIYLLRITDANGNLLKAEKIDIVH